MVGSVLAGEVLANLKVSVVTTRYYFFPPCQSFTPAAPCPQTWPVFLRVEELFILVPILLNLKGNLEMNLAARFSTSVSCWSLSGSEWHDPLPTARHGELTPLPAW